MCKVTHRHTSSRCGGCNRHVEYDNKIGDEGARAISDALEANASLQLLYLHGNYVGEALKESLRNVIRGRESFALDV